MKNFNVVKDFTIVVTIISAFLYVLGFINETVYLESFQLHNSELAPDIATSITIGFRYLFLNVFGSVVVIALLGPSLLVFISSIRKDLSIVLEKYERLTSLYRNTLQSIKWDKVKYIILIFIPAIMVLTCIHAGGKAKERAAEFKNETKSSIANISVSDGKKVTGYSGKVIRIRDNLVLFWSLKDGESHIFSQNKVVNITYKKQTPLDKIGSVKGSGV